MVSTGGKYYLTYLDFNYSLLYLICQFKLFNSQGNQAGINLK